MAKLSHEDIQLHYFFRRLAELRQERYELGSKKELAGEIKETC
jgi:hypothetical protein